ncbi:MAG TPA: PspC domain-containing protein [Candidatus Limnocylindrales bacterium]|nr:PspC domain-containing protein [Candidatus Limnocylindrales bacterium]
MTPRRLYRCRDDRKIAGVAAGIAEYFELDPTVVRVAWIISIFFGGFTILLYAILAFVMPLEPALPAGPTFGEAGPADPAAGPGGVADASEAPAFAAAAAWAPVHSHRELASREARGPGRAGLVIGVVLIAFGTIALVGPLLPGWVAGVHLGPALLVALGIALVVGAAGRTAPDR